MRMQVANPEDACTNLSVPVLDGNKPWIALIMRSERAKTECSFDVKVRTCMHWQRSLVLVTRWMRT